jgi:glycosyltransferase involved in cell wall biosynthesis
MNTIEREPNLTATTQPLVSIITVVRNGEDTIQATIDSVINQTYPHIEYIVIDGKSTDNTVEIIKNHTDNIAYWVSEPDRGISDAWNKGILAAKGDILTILNAGDTLASDYVANMVANMDIDRAMLCYGDVDKVDESGQILKTVIGQFTPHSLSDRVGFLHPGCFATKKAYELVGLFNLKYRLAMDCDWIFRSYRAGVEFKKVDAKCRMLEGGMSVSSNLAAYGECLQAMMNNGFTPVQVYSSMLTVALRGLVKSIIKKG